MSEGGSTLPPPGKESEETLMNVPIVLEIFSDYV
jgi:hypothetical protein